MRQRRVPVVSICLVLVASSISSYADNTATLAREAIATFEQRKPDLSLLSRVAEAGDKEAQFYFAETLRMLSAHITPVAHSWYEKSANQGDLYSMYRISKINGDICVIMENCPANLRSPKKWAETLRDAAQQRASQGDGEGMEMMYVITGDLEWLVRSANSGYPSAQHWLAVRYEWGDGWFFWPDGRLREIERLYEASAEGGYARAIGQQAGILLTKGDAEGATKWLMKGVSIGYVIAVANYASALQDGKYYKVEKNVILAYAINLLLSEIGGGAEDAANYRLKKLERQLSVEQVMEAAELAKVWKKEHPPLSYYPPKLEFW